MTDFQVPQPAPFALPDLFGAQAIPQPVTQDYTAPLAAGEGARARAARLRDEALTSGLGGSVPRSALDLSDHVDPVQRGAAAGIAEVYASRFAEGLGAAEADLARAKRVPVAGDRWGELYTRYSSDPAGMKAEDADAFLGLLQQFGDATDWSTGDDTAGMSPFGDMIERADFTPNGIQVTLRPKDSERAVTFGGAVDPEMVPYAPPGKGVQATVTNGKTTLRGPVNVPTIVQHRHLYPAFTEQNGDGSAIYVPSQAQFAGDVERLRKRASTLGVTGKSDTFLSSQLTRLGGHPGLTPGQSVLVDVNKDFPLDRLAKIGRVSNLGGTIRDEIDEDGLRGSRRVRQALLHVDSTKPSDAGDAALEALAFGADDVKLYTSGHPGPRWNEGREYLHRDGVTVSAFSSAPHERTASNGVTIWTQEPTRAKRFTEPVEAKLITPGMWSFGGARVLGPATASPNADLSKFMSDGKQPSHITIEPSIAQIQLGFGQAPPGLVSGRVVKGGVLFEPADGNVAQAAQAAAVLIAAGVPAHRVAVRVQDQVLRLV